jgi:hypothetical protein
MTQAQPEKRPAKQGENSGLERFSTLERLAQIRATSTERFDGYDSDIRWLLRYVDMLRKDNEQLRKRRTSFEHKMFTAVIVLVGIGVLGAIAYNIYVQPGQELLRYAEGCTYERLHSCAAWIWDYSEPLAKHPH